MPAIAGCMGCDMYVPTNGDPWTKFDPDAWIRFVAGVVKWAIKDYTAPATDRNVTPKQRREAEQFLRRHGYLREDGSIGPPLDD